MDQNGLWIDPTADVENVRCDPSFIGVTYHNTLRVGNKQKKCPKKVFAQWNIYYFTESAWKRNRNKYKQRLDDNGQRILAEMDENANFIPQPSRTVNFRFKHYSLLNNKGIHTISWHFKDGSQKEEELLLADKEYDVYQKDLMTCNLKQNQLEMIHVKLEIGLSDLRGTKSDLIRLSQREQGEDDDFQTTRKLPCQEYGHLIQYRLFCIPNDLYTLYKNQQLDHTSIFLNFEIKTFRDSWSEYDKAYISFDKSFRNTLDHPFYRLDDFDDDYGIIYITHELPAIDISIPRSNKLVPNQYFTVPPNSVNVNFDRWNDRVKLTYEIEFDMNGPSTPADIDKRRNVMFYQRLDGFKPLNVNLWIDDILRSPNQFSRTTQKNFLINSLELDLGPPSLKKQRIKLEIQVFAQMYLSPQSNLITACNEDHTKYWLFLPQSSSTWTMIEKGKKLTNTDVNFLYKPKPVNDSSNMLNQTHEIVRHVEYKCYERRTDGLHTFEQYHYLQFKMNTEYCSDFNQQRKLEHGDKIDVHIVLQNTGPKFYGQNILKSSRSLRKQSEYESVDSVLCSLITDLYKLIHEWDTEYLGSYTFHIHGHNTKSFTFSTLGTLVDGKDLQKILWDNESGKPIFTNSDVSVEPKKVLERVKMDPKSRQEIIIISSPCIQKINEIRQQYDTPKTRVQHMFIGLKTDDKSHFDTKDNCDCYDICNGAKTFKRRLWRKLLHAVDPTQKAFLKIRKVKPTITPIPDTNGRPTANPNVQPSCSLYFNRPEESKNYVEAIYKCHFTTSTSTPMGEKSNLKIKLNVKTTDTHTSSDGSLQNQQEKHPDRFGYPSSEIELISSIVKVPKIPHPQELDFAYLECLTRFEPE